MQSKTQKTKFAFTMAEVLITLGIIGIVSALTIPGLMQNIRNKDLQVQLKKTYSELNQASKLFYNDNEMTAPDYFAQYNLNKFVAEFSKYIKGVTKISDWSASNTEAELYTIFTFGGELPSSSLACDSNVGFRSDITGRYYSFDTPVAGYNGPRVCIDINGNKRPNTLGIDIFSFLFTTDGQVIPEGQTHTDNNYTIPVYSGGTRVGGDFCTKGTDAAKSIACAYYAINDKSPTGQGSYWEDFIGKKLYNK